MRNLNYLNKYRYEHPRGGMGDEHNGCFKLQLPDTRVTFVIVASNGLKWEHVSVSTVDRCPRWNEMQQIKEMFFNDDETVMQLHPAKSNYVNNHPYCLHLWKPTDPDRAIPLPPMFMV